MDRPGATGIVPLFSNLLAGIMLIASMLLPARLVQRLTDLQITSVLNLIGDKGRDVIREVFYISTNGRRSNGRPQSSCRECRA